MTIFKHRTASEVARDLKRLSKWAAGITRREVPSPEQVEAQFKKLKRRSRMLRRRAKQLQRQSEKLEQLQEKFRTVRSTATGQRKQLDRQSKELEQVSQKLERARTRVAEQTKQLDWSRRRLDEQHRWIGQLAERLSKDGSSHRTGGIDPEKMVWIFGTTRTGSTWLGSMMADLESHNLWDEPMVGRLFGQFYNSARPEKEIGQLGDPNFIMGDVTREGWVRSIRNFVLDRANNIHPRLDRRHYLVIKEPNGSIGAPLLMEALPESRMILLVRDPRDVVASRLDAVKKGNWLYEKEVQVRQGEPSLADTEPDSLVKKRSKIYSQQVGKAKEAYDPHRGPKVLVRYEELRADTLGTMKYIYSTLDIPVDEKELARVVEKHSWENIPQKEKGEGKFFRKGTAGGWREDLTPEQVKTVEEITAPLLKEFYPGAERVGASAHAPLVDAGEDETTP